MLKDNIRTHTLLVQQMEAAGRVSMRQGNHWLHVFISTTHVCGTSNQHQVGFGCHFGSSRWDIWVLDDMAARKRLWLAVAATWYIFREWWCTAGATVLSKGVGSLEIRQLERVDLHELSDSGVVWTEEVQPLRGQESCAEPFLRPEYTLGADGHNRKQAARHRSLNNYIKWRHNGNLCVEAITHEKIKVWSCHLPIHLGLERSRCKSNRSWTCQRWKFRENCWNNNSQS